MPPPLVQDEINIPIPDRLPFLEAVGWAIKDVRQLTFYEMLTCYERGWHYRGVLAELQGDELNFVRELADKISSWISGDV
ncbi:MAG: hypothetical protein V2B19_29970 [Pseudomonadota bacterium]